MKRAMILLKADEGLSEPQIMTALNVSRPCVERIRKRFVCQAVWRKPWTEIHSLGKGAN